MIIKKKSYAKTKTVKISAEMIRKIIGEPPGLAASGFYTFVVPAEQVS